MTKGRRPRLSTAMRDALLRVSSKDQAYSFHLRRHTMRALIHRDLVEVDPLSNQLSFWHGEPPRVPENPRTPLRLTPLGQRTVALIRLGRKTP